MSSYENEAPSGVVADDSYVSGSSSKNEGVPVVSDETNVEDPMDEGKADSDEQLARDDVDAIEKSNIVDERTRGAKPRSTYCEPGDEEGMPENDGTSSTDRA